MRPPVIYPFLQSGTVGIGIVVAMMFDIYNTKRNHKDFMIRERRIEKEADRLYRQFTQKLPPS
jgi:hypothetical protein